MSLLRRRLASKVFNFSKCVGPRQQVARISTTDKKKEIPSTTISGNAIPKAPETAADFADLKKRNWISYGFSTEDYHTDRDYARILFFMGITVAVCGISFTIMYIPDFRRQDWVAREARLELERRERLGLPKVDRNLVSLDRIVLPSDEELADTEIIL
ncbi:NADH dehydrogenase [ubiquinone] 1 beta subcomplex subunit 11, mitochondrial-like [Ornithodoros turicata]|uniref:NADH dehydrogenase [ubiquinone] 1 beta subcomplex subunit 11, mitochondrial-like n=1 Tax=Ornithodoros turicata TaxID=34597 RepID=UPI00313A193E